MVYLLIGVWYSEGQGGVTDTFLENELENALSMGSFRYAYI